MKPLSLLLAASLLLAGFAPAATPPPKPPPADDAVLMKPFVVAAANIFVHVTWFKDRATQTNRVLYMQVVDLNEQSAAYAAGLRKNMVIDAIDGKRVEDTTLAEFTRIMRRTPRKDGYSIYTVLQGLDKIKIRVPNDDSVEVKK